MSDLGLMNPSEGDPPHEPEAVTIAKKYAALSDDFAPTAAFDAAGAQTVDLKLLVARALSPMSEARPEGNRWQLRLQDRRRILRDLAAKNELANAVQWRTGLQDLTELDRALLDAILGRGDFALESVDRLVQALTQRDVVPDLPVLQAKARTLVLADAAAPAAVRVPELTTAYESAALKARPNPLLEFGVIGRTSEIEEILSHCRQAWAGGAVPRGIYVSGIGGIGKSTLLGEAVRRLAPEDPIVIHLDFDRPGIDEYDFVGLSLEVGRQLAIALGSIGGRLREARLREAGAVHGYSRQERRSGPKRLLDLMGSFVRDSGRPVLFVLDTMEVLAARGDESPRLLLSFLDMAREFGVGPQAVIAAGRGDLPVGLVDSMAEIRLEKLDGASAHILVEAMQVPESVRRPIITIADGHPLVLRLAGHLVKESGAGTLTDLEGLPAGVGGEILAAHLYRMLLSRLQDPDLQAIAHPGLLLRRLNPHLVADVLAPEVSSKSMSVEQAADLLDRLSRHAWLVGRQGEWVFHRSDLREVLLPLQIGINPAQAKRLNLAAAAWFRNRWEPWAAAEALYHRLQATRSGASLPADIDPDAAARMDKTMLQELPEKARDAVLLARGERSSFSREAASALPDMDAADLKVTTVQDASADLQALERLAEELAPLLSRDRLEEVAGLLDRTPDLRAIDPQSHHCDTLLEALYRVGRWGTASQLLMRRDNVRPDRPLPTVPTEALAQAQLRAVLRPGELRRQLRENSNLLGHIASLATKIKKIGGPVGWFIMISGESQPSAATAAAWIWGAETQGDQKAGESFLRDQINRAVKLAGADDTVIDTIEGLTARLQQSLTAPSGGTPPEDLTLASRLLSVGSPYIATARAGVLGPKAEKWHELGLRLAKSYPFGLLEGVPVQPETRSSVLIESVDERGRLAEFLGGLQFLLPHPDLRGLADAAERHRRTVGGHWSYGRPPRGWRQQPVDAMVRAQLDILLDANNPVARSLETLRSFAELLPGEGDPIARLLAQLETPIAGISKPSFGSWRDAVWTLASRLYKKRIPVMILPALSVYLCSLRR